MAGIPPRLLGTLARLLHRPGLWNVCVGLGHYAGSRILIRGVQLASPPHLPLSGKGMDTRSLPSSWSSLSQRVFTPTIRPDQRTFRNTPRFSGTRFVRRAQRVWQSCSSRRQQSARCATRYRDPAAPKRRHSPFQRRDPARPFARTGHEPVEYPAPSHSPKFTRWNEPTVN